jgi:outer membrane protein TolC
MKLGFPLFIIACATPVMPAFAAEKLTFSQALELARIQSLEKQKTTNAVDLAKHERRALEQKDDAKITASATGLAKYSENPGSGTTSRTVASPEPGTFDETYALQASGSIYDFGRTSADRTKVNLAISEKESLLAEVEEALVIKVSRAFARVLSAQTIADLAQKQIQNATQKFDQVKLNYSRGLRPEYDVVRAESDLGRARIAVQKSQDDKILAWQQLQFLTGDSPLSPNRSVVCEGIFRRSKESWEKAASVLSEPQTPAALRTKKIQRAMNASEIEAIDAKILPSLSGTLGAGITRTTPFPETKSNDYRTTYSGGLTLSWDIPWNSGSQDDKMRIALKDKDLQMSEEMEIKSRKDKSESTKIRIKSFVEQSALMEKQVALVLKNLSIVKQKYESGKASATELSVAEDEALTTQTEAVRTQASALDALLDLAEATGNRNVETIFNQE